MPRSIEHLVEAHRLGRERRNKGLPTWAYHVPPLNISYLEDERPNAEALVETARAIASLLTRSLPKSWLEDVSDDFDEEYDRIVDFMRTIDPKEYPTDTAYSMLEAIDDQLEALYDWADLKRVWISPFQRIQASS